MTDEFPLSLFNIFGNRGKKLPHCMEGTGRDVWTNLILLVRKESSN